MQSLYSPWIELTVALTVGAVLVVGVAVVVDRQVRSAVWRRTLWQAAALSLWLVLLVELSGVNHGLGRFMMSGVTAWRALEVEAPVGPACRAGPGSAPSLAPGPGPVRQPGPTEDPRNSIDVQADVADSARAYQGFGDQMLDEGSMLTPSLPIAWLDPVPLSSPSPVDTAFASESQSSRANESPALSTSARQPQNKPLSDRVAFWPAVVWGFGCLFALSFVVAGRVSLFRFGRRIRTLDDVVLRRRIDRLAGRIGLRSTVRLMESQQVATPVAFGTFSPTLVLPPGFTDDFDTTAQEAMLAHELAHLAARDSAWQLLARLLCAALWWHPAAWLLRRRLQIASEAAADEASLLVPDGPRRLADCLVEMGRRLARPRPAAWLQVTGGGYRSDLGKRVVRLLGLEGTAWPTPRRWRTGIAKCAIVLLLIVTVVCCTAWARPQVTSREGETTMTLLKSGWSRSLVSVALVTVWGSVSSDATAGPPQSDPAITDTDMVVALLAEDDEREEHEVRREREEREVRREREREEREREARERERREREAMKGEHRERGQEERERAHHEREMDRERAVDNMMRERAEIIERAHHLEREMAELPADADKRAAEIRTQLREIEEAVRRIDAEVREIKGEPPRREGPPQERGPREEMERRLHHLRVAIDNLKAAGMHDAAEHLMKEGERLARELGEGEHHPPRDHHPEHPRPEERPEGPPHPEQFERAIHEMHQQMDQMRREMAEMKQAIKMLIEREHHE